MTAGGGGGWASRGWLGLSEAACPRNGAPSHILPPSAFSASLVQSDVILFLGLLVTIRAFNNNLKTLSCSL